MPDKTYDVNASEYQYAGFWARFAAYLLDIMIVFAGTLILRFILGCVSLFTGITLFDTEVLFSFSLKDILIYLCNVVYFVVLTYYTGATLGKKAMNLKVITSSNESLTLMDVLYRETIGRYLSGCILYIGYLLSILDNEKRTLHDILCDTRVIYAKKIKIYPEYQAPAMPPGYIPPYSEPHE